MRKSDADPERREGIDVAVIVDGRVEIVRDDDGAFAELDALLAEADGPA